MDFLKEFFQGYTATELINMLVIAVIFINKNAGVKFLNWLKTYFGFSGAKAQSFVLGLLAVIVILSMFITGQIGEVKFNLKTFLSIFLAALIPAKFAYKRLMGRG